MSQKIHISCFIILILLLIIKLRKGKENYKRQRRQGIRGGWRRKGNAAKNVALKGTRWHKLPPVDEVYSSYLYRDLFI